MARHKALLWLGPDRPGAGDAALLDAEERSRAARLVREDDRARFVAAHALLRRALSCHWAAPPVAWRFRRDPGGRPWVDGEGPYFSLSHCPGLVAVLVADAPACGVDCELTGRVSDPLRVARGLFSPSERLTLEAADPTLRARRFSELWCLNEAWSKAMGGGLALPVERVAFSVADDGAVGLELPPGLGRAADWTLRLWAPDAEHIVAVALGGGESWDLSDTPARETEP